MPQFINKTFHIKTLDRDWRRRKDGSRFSFIQVEGWACGFLGYHEEEREAFDCDIPVVDYVYPITHIRTGLAICWAKDHDSAEKIILFLLKYEERGEINWSNLNTLSPEQRKEFNSLHSRDWLVYWEAEGWLCDDHDAIQKERMTPQQAKGGKQ